MAAATHTNLPDFAEGDKCPVHGTDPKTAYTFGSSMSAETDVCVFKGCRCAVAIRHDPIGGLDSVATLHDCYATATGVARLHARAAAAKYR